MKQNSFFEKINYTLICGGSRLLITMLFIALTIFIPATTKAQPAANNQEWIGSYSFTDEAPPAKRRSQTDVAPFASYEVTVEEGEEDGRLSATFSASGVQLFETYKCAVKATPDKAAFYFEDVGSLEIENFRRFNKGDLLFTLFKTKTGKTTKYLFEPAKYEIIRVVPSKQKNAVYFGKL